MDERTEQLLKRDVEDVKAVLRLDSGRRLIFRLLCAAGVYNGPRDPYTQQLVSLDGLGHQAGMRDVGLWLKHEIEIADPDGYHELMMEQRKQEHLGYAYRRSNAD